jgi:hypothetical protein
MLKSQQAIVSIQLGASNITFQFANFWYQDDIECLSSKVIEVLPNIRVIEMIKGADRENIRLVWQEQYYYSLSFDCYSQSCWLEGEDEASNEQLKMFVNNSS